MNVVAQYESQCPECDRPIRVGQEIEPIFNDAYCWRHLRCPVPQPVCPVCFMEKSADGTCECES